MDLVQLTEFIVKNLVSEKDMVSVKQFDDEESIITIQVIVSNNDMGAVIGKGGVNANAIRTLVQAAAYANNMPHVKINIDSI